MLRKLLFIILGFSICFSQTKSPTRAMVYSALLPGAGQWYNQQYLKMPIALSANLWAGWNVYERKKVFESDNSTANLEARNTSVWLFSLIYGLNILDAFVDAHLYETGKRESHKRKIKDQYFLINFASTITVDYFTLYLDFKKNPTPVISLNSVASISKEIWDLNRNKNFECAVLAVDVFGIIAGIWIINKILE